jgi:bifunctional UDP-N-acetylglucosamine pyrophosphorylase / glucosamine-1-phosphate N-acetyltransferase
MALSSTQPDCTAPHAIILAAGKGTRMGSDRPKVAHEVAGKAMVYWVVRACVEAGVSRVIVVIGHGGDEVRSLLAGEPACVFVEQLQQLGTGHAAKMAQHLFDASKPADVFVLAGDAPLIRSHTLKTMLDAHRSTGASATMATSILDDPEGYGRIVRDAAGKFDRIVEQKDATPAQRAIREINPSYYCFRSDALFATLSRVGRNNSQGEYYLTDVPTLLQEQGQTVSVVDAVPPEDVLGINTPQQLSQVDGVLRNRLGVRPVTQEATTSR